MSAGVHQVLATLGYGDAIGHEVLGIQRALQGAGYESEIFVETADRRLESLTTDYREMVGTIAASGHPDPPLFDRVTRVENGVRARRPHGARLPQHHAAGVLHRRPQEAGEALLSRRRELTAYVGRCDVALGDSEYNRQELEALGFANTDVLPVVPDFSHLDGPPNPMIAADFDDGWTNILFVGRVIPNKKFEDVIRAFHVYRTRYNPRSRLLLVGSYSGFETYFAMLQSVIAQLGVRDVHFLGHVSNEELTALYDVADLFLCASEHEGFCVPLVESFYKRVPVLAFASTAVPATMDGGGVLYDRRIHSRSRR